MVAPTLALQAELVDEALVALAAAVEAPPRAAWCAADSMEGALDAAIDVLGETATTGDGG